MQNPISHKTLQNAVYAIIGLWVLCIFIINPIGDFPLNDDWSYGQSVQNLVENGVLDFCDWIAMPLITQVLYGSVWAKLFGFSFSVLRISTLALSVFGIYGTYQLLKAQIKHNGLVLMGVILLAFNPIYFNLSYTFMTDVPFYVLTIWALHYLLLYLKSQEKRDLAIGIVFAVLATFIRQSGLFLILAFTAVSIWKHRSYWLILLPVFTGVALFSLPILIDEPHMNGRNLLFFENWLGDSNSGFIGTLKNTPFMLFYGALFLFPILILLVQNKRREWFLLGIGIVASVAFLWDGHLFPYWGNIIHNAGIGPIHLKDIALDQLPLKDTLNGTFLVLSILAVYGAYKLVVLVFEKLKHDTQNDERWFLLSFLILYSGVHLWSGAFDRYFLIAIPVLILLIAQAFEFQKWKAVLITIFTLSMIFFSIAGTHDYLAWNKARWKAIMNLEAIGVTSDDIDGGFEYNGLRNYDRSFVRENDNSYWWVKDDQFIIEYQYPIRKGYAPHKNYAYPSWLFMKEKRIYVSKRTTTILSDSY